MQCKLKQGATVSNDFELQEGKYNAITKIISSPVFDEEGNIVKDGVFEAESFDSKDKADEYIDRRYQELLNRYKKLKNEAHQKLNQKLKEYEQQLEKDYEEYKKETDTKNPNPYETGNIVLSPEEGYFEKSGKDKEKRKITAEIKKQLENTINKIIELSDKLKADSSLDKEFKELQKEIGKINSFKAQGFKLSEAQEDIIDSALELVNEINQETYTEAEELFTIGDTTNMALFGSEIEPSKINKLEKDTKLTKETIDNIESKLLAVQDMFKEIEQYDLNEEELAGFKENYGKIYVVVKQLESGVVDGSNLIKAPVAEVIELTIDEAIDIIENRNSYEGKLSDKLDNALSQIENLGETKDDIDGETPDDIDDLQEEVYDLENEEGVYLIYRDPDTGEVLPYRLKAESSPIYTGGYMSNVLIYSTTKPSETKTVDGKTVAVNSKMESAVTNLWENNLNSIWNAADQTTMEEEYGSLEKFISGSKAAIESLNDNFDNKLFEFRKFKKTYPNFPIDRKLKVIDDTHHEVLVIGVTIDNKFYPIGEVRNPDGDYDTNGKSYKGVYGNNQQQRQQYQRAYLAIKYLWDNAGYDYSYTPEGYNFKYKGQYEIKNDNKQVLVKDLINNGHKNIYAVFSGKVFEYNKEDREWNEVKNENESLSIKKIERDKKSGFKNYILVKTNGTFQKLALSNIVNDTSLIKDHNDGMNEMLRMNYDDISDNIKGFSIKKSGNVISAAITLFRFGIITRYNNNVNVNHPHTFSVVKKSEGLQTPKVIQTINLSPDLRLITDIYIRNSKVNIETYLSESKEDAKGKVFFKKRRTAIKSTEIESYDVKNLLIHLKSVVNDKGFSEYLQGNNIKFNIKDHFTFNANSNKDIGNLLLLNNLRPIVEITSSNIPVQKNDYVEKEKARKEEEAIKAAEAAQRAAEEAIKRQEENNAAYQKTREDAVVLMSEIFSGETNIKGKGVRLVSSVFRESSYNQSFENSEEAFRVVVYKGKKYFIGKTSKNTIIVFDDTILNKDKDTSKSKVGEVKNPEILNEVLNNDDLTIGYISGVVYNNARYIVHGNGRIISFTSGKDVFEKNSDNKIEKISELVEYVNKEVFGYEETVEEGVTEQTDEFTEDNNFANDPIKAPEVDDTQVNTGTSNQKPETTTANPATINENSLFNMFGGKSNAPIVDGGNIGDNIGFSTSDQKATQQDISKARKILSKIVPFDVREMDPMIQNMLNDKTAIGAFYKNAIYLLDGTQKFHEAFHGIFRTILTDKEVDDVIREAEKKYAKPSLDEISRLRYLTEHNQTLSTEQLINLYYEEKLAEDFQQYMDTGRSVWSRIWDKILDIIRFITGGERDRIYSLFRNIENGKYASNKIRTNSPYAFREPAFAVINTIRSNSYNNPAKFFVPANQTKTISALVAKEIFDDNIDKKKKEDYYPYFSKVREVFNPIKWYEYFKVNNDPNIVSNMMTILDYYNALAIPGEPMFMIDANGEIKQVVNVDNIINRNIKSIIGEVNELLKFYVNNDENGESLDDENNNDDHEDETGEPVEIFNRDSYKFGGFKSETSAIRNLMAIITYDKKLFTDVSNNKVGDFQGEITMPVQAERLYNKILMLTSGVAKENILDVIAQAADSSNYDIQAFYNYIKEKIDNETSISNNDILVREGGVYDSPTYNLLIKAFYKNNHDYLHVRKRGNDDIAYYPNKFSIKSRVLQRWRNNEKGVMALKTYVRERFLEDFQDIISEKLDVNDDYTFMKQMKFASEYLRDATGIELSPLYLKYTYYKRSGIPSAFDNIKLPYITNNTLIVLFNNISSGGSLFQSDTVNNEINKILEASAYFNEEQVTFMLRNPEGEQIFTSLYNSYDTEILNTIKESFVEGYFNVNVLREKLEQLGYGEQFVDRFMSMVSMNPIFSQKGLNEKDFDVLYSFGMDNDSYNKLTDFDRRSYKAKIYKNLPADLSNRKIYNPLIIEAKNTNKLFKFSSFEKEISFKDGEYNVGEGVEEAINMLYLIEKDSIMRYNEDIENLVKTGQLEYFIKDYHYRELELRDGSIGKVVYYNNDYYLISENYDTKSYDSHNVFTGYTAEKLQYIPDGFKEPKGAKFFNFGGLDLYNGNVKEFLVSMYLNMNSKDSFVLDNVFNEYQGDQKESKKFQFFVDDLIASSSFQYLLYGGSPTINHKDYVDITKRNAGVNANGSSIGNTSTVFAMIESKELNIDDEYIKINNQGGNSQDVQDAQNYATAMWYFSKYAKYKGVASEKGEIRDIALKVVAGIKLTSDEVRILEKNNMLLIDRKIVVRNTFVYDKTSVHIQAREKVSILREKNTDLVIRRWKEYLENPSPELYNKIIMPMYVAKTGFEYHHNMLNSMEAQGIDITMVTSASKNSTFNVAKNPKNLRGFIVDDRFIHEQVRTDNIKTTITDPTQPLALVFSEQGSPQFQAIGEKFNTIQSRRIFEATNKNISSVFTGRFNDPDYEKIWDVVKDSIAATDPQLYELLDVENGIPRYNWNIPNVNAKILSAYNSAMSKNSLKQKVKGSKMNLVASYGHGNDLNWKVTDDRFPGVFFSEVYVSQYFLDKMGLKVGDIMWGTRIPTQDKHSMGNLIIKGVIEGPYAMSIMIPKEMLFLSGADHDLDSLFVKVLNYNYSQNTINAIMDPDADINKLYDDILNERKRQNPNFDEIALFDDLLLLTGVALTHNEANQDIYATKASLDAIKNSKVRRNENPIQSSISFSDRNNSEDSNYTSKGGIGPAAVLNLVFQKLAKAFPKEFKFTNVEGKRVNDLISTQVSGMTDDPKEQIMSGYGLTKNNINKVITLMIAGDITYDQALLSVRDSGFTYAKTEKDRIVEAKYMISKNDVIDDELVKQYEEDGYVFQILENEKGEKYLKSVSNPNIPTINNVYKAKVYDNASFLLGEIIRVNRKLPSKADDFFRLENSMWSTAGIKVLRKEVYEGDAEYSKINNLFLATNNEFVISDKKIYVDLGTHFTVISFDSKPNKRQKDVNEMVMKVIESDDLVFNQLASYLVQSEFASKIFMKYSKIYNKMINKLKEKYNDLIEEASVYGMYDLVNSYKNIKDNIGEYAMAIMNGQKFLADNKKSLYEGLLTESIDDKSYIQFLSERILMEDSGIRLLKDIRYSTVVNEDSGKTYHIASLFTVGEDSDFIRTTYSNDYSNMLNASDNRTVLKEFIAAPNKKAFIESLSLADAKVLMVGFIFDYAMLKDGMMYSGTSFSKIIDPRLFISYGNSINSLQKSFSSNQEFARQYTNNNFSKIDDHVSRMINYVFNSLNESIKTKEARAIGINLSRYKPDTNKKATFIFASSGLGKSSLVKNANKRGDSRYVDIDYIIQEALDEVYPNDKGKHTNTAENSRRLGLETSVQNKLKELLSTKYSDKIVLGSISNEKLKAIGFSYSKYYVPSESMIPNIIKGIAERGKGAKDTISGNAYDIEFEKYKRLYYDLYVSPNFVDKDKVVVVDSYLDDVINIDKGSIFTETANVSDVVVNGTTYQVIEQSVYKDKKDITSSLSTQLYSLILATRDFADGDSTKQTFNGKEYYVYNENKIFDIENMGFLSEDEIDVLTGKTETEFEGEPIEILSVIESLFNKYKDKEILGQPITKELLEQLANEFGIDNLEDTLKNCI